MGLEVKNVEGLETRLAAVEAAVAGAPGNSIIIDVSADLTSILSSPVQLIAGVLDHLIVVHEAVLRHTDNSGLGNVPGGLVIAYDTGLDDLGQPICEFDTSKYGQERFLEQALKKQNYYTSTKFPRDAGIELVGDANLVGGGKWEVLMTYSIFDLS